MTLKELRKSKGWTQAKVAELACVSQRAVSNYESGERVPSRKVASKLAGIFGLSKAQAWDIFNKAD